MSSLFGAFLALGTGLLETWRILWYRKPNGVIIHSQEVHSFFGKRKPVGRKRSLREKGEGMAKVNLPYGIDNFAKVRDSNCYYIDKTRFIKELVDRTFDVNLIV